MVKALVTGGSGFIGKALCRELLEHGLEAWCFDIANCKNEINYRRGSVMRLEDVEQAVEEMDIVFHLAGLVGTTELLECDVEAVQTNIIGTINVLSACLKHGVKRVFCPTKPCEWLNTYSITKNAAAKFAQMYADVHSLDVRGLRWLNAYGPGQSMYPVRKAVPVMILQGLYGLDMEIWGDGEQPVDLIHVGDLARNTVLYTLSENRGWTARDTGNTTRMSVNELAELIRRLTKSRGGIKHYPMRLGEDPSKSVSLLSMPTAAEMLGISEVTTPVETGMLGTIEYYRALPSKQHENALEFYYGRENVEALQRGVDTSLIQSLDAKRLTKLLECKQGL
jgi:UDP-glucose 4-epimerase